MNYNSNKHNELQHQQQQPISVFGFIKLLVAGAMAFNVLGNYLYFQLFGKPGETLCFTNIRTHQTGCTSKTQPAQHSKAIPVSVQQTKNKDVYLRPHLADESNAVIKQENKLQTPDVGIPDSVYPGSGVKGIETVVFEPSQTPKLPQVSVPLSQLELNAQDEALHTRSKFQQAVDKTQPVPTQQDVTSTPAQPIVQQTANQDVAIHDILTDESNAASIEEKTQQPETRYGVTRPILPKHAGIPNSVFQGVGEYGIAQQRGMSQLSEITNAEIPQVGQTLEQLNQQFLQNQQDEYLRTQKAFQQAVDETQLLPTHYPTVYSGGATDLQEISDKANAQIDAVVARKPKPSIPPFTTR